MHRVYLDNHATTPMDPVVWEAMRPYCLEHFGNPGSIGHDFGETARQAVKVSRQSIAELLGVNDSEIVFTSGATESNNLALRGIAERFRQQGGHFVSVTTEHKAVLDPLARIKQWGFEVTLLEPEPHESPTAGLLRPQQVADALRNDTRLVSVMLANNEIGAIQPLAEITAICHQHGVPVHCDATQAVGKISLDWSTIDADLISFSGHKMYGPRGVGALVVRRRRPRIRLIPLIDGGGQESGLRSGTLNVPGIVGLELALRRCEEDLEARMQRVRRLRDRLFDRITSELPDVTLNGPEFDHRLPHNLNLCFRGVDGEALMMQMADVAVSSGSACTSANPEPSHVLRAIGRSEDETRSSLRFGIGRFNQDEEIEFAADVVIAAVERLRAMR